MSDDSTGNNDENDNKGREYPLTIDADLRYHQELSWNHRVIVQIVLVLAGEGQEVYITDAGLGKNLGLPLCVDLKP